MQRLVQSVELVDENGTHLGACTTWIPTVVQVVLLRFLRVLTVASTNQIAEVSAYDFKCPKHVDRFSTGIFLVLTLSRL
jgi:hypothetical protein